ncbi:hypothetical protein ACJ41O_009361 [Fusarium nematophilum]
MLLPALYARMTPTSQPVDPPSDGSSSFKSPSPDAHTTVKIIATVWAFGWVCFGLITIMSINGLGRTGRWIPEWYLDSRGSAWDKLSVVGWWIFVILFWPLIWVADVVGMACGGVRELVGRWKERRAGRDKTEVGGSDAS